MVCVGYSIIVGGMRGLKTGRKKYIVFGGGGGGGVTVFYIVKNIVQWDWVREMLIFECMSCYFQCHVFSTDSPRLTHVFTCSTVWSNLS
jgi:hypothetical protein